jgi:uncharacterized iron-regulated protein
MHGARGGAPAPTTMDLLGEAREVAVFAAAPTDRRFALPANWVELVQECAAADVVIIGELHGHPLGLAVGAVLFEDLLKEADSAALSLEFFERDDQSRLDDYLHGVADEATFKRRSGRAAGNYPDGHRLMVEAAKAAARPVHASNAPRATVRLARRDGFDAIYRLTEEQRRLVRIPDWMPGPEDRYRTEFESLMEGALSEAHGESEDPEERAKMIEGMFRAQILWDWTMAHSIARAVSTGDVPVVHVVGRFHSDFGGGMVQALEHLASRWNGGGKTAGLRIVTLSISDRWSDHLREDDEGRADYVIYVGPAK